MNNPLAEVGTMLYDKDRNEIGWIVGKSKELNYYSIFEQSYDVQWASGYQREYTEQLLQLFIRDFQELANDQSND